MTTDAGASGAPRFDVVLRGYDRRQVDEHVARLQRVLTRMRADLEVARNQPPPQARPAPVMRPISGGLPVVGPQGQPGDRPRPTPRPRPDLPVPDGASPDTIGTFTGRMESILQAAEDEAAEIRNKARSDEGQVRSQLMELTRQRDAMLAELARMRGQLESLLSAPTARMTVPPQAGPSGSGPHPARPGPGAVPPPDRGTPGRGLPVPGPPQLPAVPPSGAAEPASATPGASGADGPTPEGPASDGPTSESGTTDGAGSGSAGLDGPAPERRTSGTQAPDAAAGPQRPPFRNGVPAPGPAQGRPAAHRLASGAYSAVERTDSMRPRTEPDPEPGELFRPGPRIGDEPARAAAGDREPDGVESTVRVGAVPPADADATVLAKAVPPSEPKGRAEDADPGATPAADGGNGTGGQDRTNRSATGSRSR